MASVLGQRIQELRKQKEYTLEQLAQLVGSSKSYIWELENQENKRPSASKLSAIADALDTTFEYLLSAEDIKKVDAADQAFFNNYLTLDTRTKNKMQKMLKLMKEK